jgi:hypothetical protein
MRLFLAVVIFSWVGVGSAFAASPQDEFYSNLRAICGHSYLGKVVESNESDETWRQSKIVIHAPACDVDTSSQIHIPLHVGENTSRTWIVSKTPTGLRLKHDHRHEDGTPDAVSMYGGDTVDIGTANQQAFPVDEFSKAVFIENDIAVSITNTWTISIEPKKTLTYRLSRPGRLFEVEFNLEKPLN